MNIYLKNSVPDIMLSVIPGVILILIAYLTKEKIGKGDGCIVIIMGICLGLERTILSLVIAFTMTAVFSLGFLVFKKVKKDYEVPFAPFILAAVIVLSLGNVL